MTEKLNIPKFASETEEAEWWDQHREETAHWLEEAVAAGATSSLSDILQRARERSGGRPRLAFASIRPTLPAPLPWPREKAFPAKLTSGHCSTKPWIAMKSPTSG
jgi:hypothetical protein